MTADLAAGQALCLDVQLSTIHRHEDAPLGARVLDGDRHEPVDDAVQGDLLGDGQ